MGSSASSSFSFSTSNAVAPSPVLVSTPSAVRFPIPLPHSHGLDPLCTTTVADLPLPDDAFRHVHADFAFATAKDKGTSERTGRHRSIPFPSLLGRTGMTTTSALLDLRSPYFRRQKLTLITTTAAKSTSTGSRPTNYNELLPHAWLSNHVNCVATKSRKDDLLFLPMIAFGTQMANHHLIIWLGTAECSTHGRRLTIGCRP